MVKNVVILICVVLSFIACRTTKEAKNAKNDIGKHIKISAYFAQDTIVLGEMATLRLLFENKSDSSITFYPRASISLYISASFFSPTSVPLSFFRSTDFPVVLEPGHFFKDTYQIEVAPPLFKSGENVFCTSYSCKKLTGKWKKYNKLYGYLESYPFVVYVKDK